MPTDRISARIDAFTKELEQLVREAAVEAVEAALSTGASRPASSRLASSGRGSSGRARARTAPRRSARAAPARRSAGRPTPATAKPTGDIDQATIAYVKGHPGLRLEEIAKALGVPSPGLKGRVAQLVDARKLRKTGKTRGTKYFVP